MAAALDLVEPAQIGEGLLSPAPRRSDNFLREHGDTRGCFDRFCPLLQAGEAFPVQTRRGRCARREPTTPRHSRRSAALIVSAYMVRLRCLVVIADRAFGSVKFERESKCVVDRSEFFETDSPYEVAESFRCNCRSLFDKNLCFFVVDCDGGTKGSRRSRSRRWGNEQGRQHQIVGLDDHGESGALLFPTSSISWRS